MVLEARQLKYSASRPFRKELWKIPNFKKRHVVSMLISSWRVIGERTSGTSASTCGCPRFWCHNLQGVPRQLQAHSPSPYLLCPPSQTRSAWRSPDMAGDPSLRSVPFAKSFIYISGPDPSEGWSLWTSTQRELKPMTHVALSCIARMRVYIYR